MSTKTILFTGGGTGGHVTPNLAISQSIQKAYPSAHFCYVGKKGKAEESMVPKGWSHLFDEKRASLHFVQTTSGSPKSPVVLLTLFMGFLQAILLLLRYRPDIIIASGGYVSAPILFAAGILRKLYLIPSKIMLHEANAEVGKMNQMAIRFADIVAYSFPGTDIDKRKKRFVGYPVRENIVQQNAESNLSSKVELREKLGIPSNAKYILAFGGSQGARTINRGIVDSLPILLSDPDVYIMHGTGKKLSGASYDGLLDVENKLKEIKNRLPADYAKRYVYKDFMDNIGDYYTVADLVVCRGGAGSLVEVCAKGMAAVCIPKADLAGDHQAVNARVLERLGAIQVIFESKDPLDSKSLETIDTKEFATIVFELLNNPEKRASMGAIASEQYDPTTAQKCTQIVQHLLKDISEAPILREEPHMPEETILGKDLLGIISRLQKERISPSLTPEERRMVLYKIDIAATKKDFVNPARACRMIGIGRFSERLPVLLHFSLDQNKSPFTRRDAFVGIRHLEIITQEVFHTIIKGLSDPYFETVNEALYALFVLLQKHILINRISTQESIDLGISKEQVLINSMKKELFSHVAPFSQSKEFDIRMNALGVISLLVDDFSEIKPHLEANYFHPNWQVRKRIVECYQILQQRKRINIATVQQILTHEFLQTSNGFDMDFLLKSEIKNLFQQEKSIRFTNDLKTILFSSSSQQEKETSLRAMHIPNLSLRSKEIISQMLSFSPEEFYHHEQKQILSSEMNPEEKQQALVALDSFAQQHNIPISAHASSHLTEEASC